MPRVSEKERAVRDKTMPNASLYKQDSCILIKWHDDRVINEWTSADVNSINCSAATAGRAVMFFVYLLYLHGE